MFRGFFPEYTTSHRPSPFFSPFEEDLDDGYVYPSHHGSGSRRQRELERQLRMRKLQQEKERIERQREEQLRRNYILQRQKEEREQEELQRLYLEKRRQQQQHLTPKQSLILQQKQQQKEEQLRRKELQKQKEEELRRRREEQEQQKRALLQRKIRAATTIQRAFRPHFQRRTQAAITIQRAFRRHLLQKRHASAFILQRLFRTFLAKKQAQSITSKLRALEQLSQQIEILRREREAHVLSTPVYERPGDTLPNKQFLELEDALLKMMIKLDGIMSEGSEIVREKRKAIVGKVNRTLAVLDALSRRERKGGDEVDLAPLHQAMEFEENGAKEKLDEEISEEEEEEEEESEDMEDD